MFDEELEICPSIDSSKTLCLFAQIIESIFGNQDGVSQKCPPKLTGVAGWYETYYDVYKGGRFIFEIERWHQQYGK